MPSRSRSSAWRANSVPLSCVTPVLAPARQRGEHEEPRSDAFAGGLVGHDARHKETRAPFDLGVRVASHADDAVGLPLAEPGTVGWPAGPLVDGCPERYAAPGRAPALRPAPAAMAPRRMA